MTRFRSWSTALVLLLACLPLAHAQQSEGIGASAVDAAESNDVRDALIDEAVAAFSGPLLAKERILDHRSLIEVRADGSLDITETIRVHAKGLDIRRGIYRDFPTRYKDRIGNRVVVDFEVLGVQRDGHDEPWFTERHGNGVRVNTGNDALLAVPADITYTLHYRTTRQLGFFADHDELYFNAIGTGWAFPIERGSAEVRLPQPVAVAQMTAEGYTGGYGQQGDDVRTSTPRPGIARWTLTRALAPGEGMTIVLSFPKGVVTAPTLAKRAGWLLRDNLGLLVALSGLVALLWFCIARWRKVGRDPRPGTIIVRYDPPDGHSPADLRYVERMGYDNRCFSSDLLACAVDGGVRIHRDKKLLKDAWRLERTGALSATAAEGERALLDRLFSGGSNALELDSSNASRVQGAMAAHTAHMKKRFQPAMFSRNGCSIGIAVAIMVVSIALTAIVGALSGSGPILIVPLLVMVPVLTTFVILVKAPTQGGRRLLDEIQGFRRYLGVAERDELASLPGPGAPPPLDAKRYEYLLPYAVALDVEDAWTKKFTVAVGAAAAAATTAAIAWYQGGHVNDLGSLTQSIGNSLTSQIASSSSPPGSSSGGGGGGFSGGGGGGGGGGGR